jgi:hypothetical protein
VILEPSPAGSYRDAGPVAVEGPVDHGMRNLHALLVARQQPLPHLRAPHTDNPVIALEPK